MGCGGLLDLFIVVDSLKHLMHSWSDLIIVVHCKHIELCTLRVGMKLNANI